MTTKRRTTGGSSPGAGWVRPWMQLVEIAWSAPVVIGYRAARMVTGGWPPGPRDRREYRRMVQEKVEGFSQVVVAAASLPMGTGTGVGDVLAPVHRRVVANRRRLSRR